MDYERVGAAKGLSLLCRIGTLTCALPVASVVEIMRPLPVRVLAGAPDFVLGIALIRGAPTAVIDSNRLLQGTASTQPLRFVRLNVNGRSVALAVDEVVGIRDLTTQSFETLPPVLSACTDVAEKMSTLDEQLLVVLNTARLIPESLWLALKNGKAS